MKGFMQISNLIFSSFESSVGVASTPLRFRSLLAIRLVVCTSIILVFEPHYNASI